MCPPLSLTRIELAHTARKKPDFCVEMWHMSKVTFSKLLLTSTVCRYKTASIIKVQLVDCLLSMMQPLLPLLFASSHSAGRHSKLLPQMHSVYVSRPCCRLSHGCSGLSVTRALTARQVQPRSGFAFCFSAVNREAASALTFMLLCTTMTATT